MSWQLLIILQSMLSGYRSIVGRRIGMEKQDASPYVLIVSFICVWVTGLVVAVYKSEPLNLRAVWNLRGFILIGGLLFGAANLLSIKLFRLVSASVAALLSLLNTLAVVAVASFFGGERLSVTQIAGGLLLLVAVFLAEIVTYISKRQPKKTKKLRVTKSLAITVVLSVFFALGVVNEKYLLGHLSLSTYLVFGWGAQFCAALTLYLIFRKKQGARNYSRSIYKNAWVSGLLLAVGGLFFVMSLSQSKSSSLVVLASSAKVVVAMVLAYFLLNEKEGIMLKVISVLLSSVGLLLLLR